MINLIEKFYSFLLHEKANDNAHIYLWSKDREGKYLSCNKLMYQDVGFKNESDMLGLTDLDLCWERQGILFRQNDNLVMYDKKSHVFVEPSKTISGKEINFYSYKTPLYSCHSKRILGTIGLSIPMLAKEINHLNNTQDSILKKLSAREKQCIIHYLNGKTAKETATLMSLSFRTIEEYFSNIKKKLNCQNKRDILTLLNNIQTP